MKLKVLLAALIVLSVVGAGVLASKMWNDSSVLSTQANSVGQPTEVKSSLNQSHIGTNEPQNNSVTEGSLQVSCAFNITTPDEESEHVLLPEVTLTFSESSYPMSTKTETILKLEAVYDDTNHALRLLANLTDADGHPLIGQTVNFAIQFESNRNWGKGWLPLGSSKTDENGAALLWQGLNTFAGHHQIKASFPGNDYFSKSEAFAYIDVPLRKLFVYVAGLDKSDDTFEVTLVVVDGREYYPLPGKTILVKFLNTSYEPIYVVSDEEGAVKFNFPMPVDSLEYVELEITVLQDWFTSEFKTIIVLDLSKLMNSDNTPPTTALNVGEPKLTVNNTVYLTSDTSITLTAEDNPESSGVATTSYRIYNETYDSGWVTYGERFYLVGLSDGVYSMYYNSTDNAGNVEAMNSVTLVLDNSPPLLTVETPLENEALHGVISFATAAWDLSKVASINFSIREPDGEQGKIISSMFESMPATLSADGKWKLIFDTMQLPDQYYLAVVESNDILDNKGFRVVSFSVRNWAIMELLPASESNKAGRTMPIKFSLRKVACVDLNQLFVRNEELTIIIIEKVSSENILQTSTYGTTARDYRIDDLDELYITNFQTLKTPTTYVVQIFRKGLLIGTFEFSTVK